MRNTLHDRGKWWLPQNPDQKTIGEVTHDPGQWITLTLHDTPDWSRGGFREGFQLGTIYGELANGRILTLWDCSCTEISSDLKNRTSGCSQANASVALLGGHYSNADDTTFDEIGFCFEHVHRWWQHHGFECDFAATHEGLSVEYIFPPAFEADIPDGRITIHRTLNKSEKYYQNFTLSSEIACRFTSRMPMTLTAMRQRVLRPMVNLISLAVGRMCSVADIWAIQHCPQSPQEHVVPIDVFLADDMIDTNESDFEPLFTADEIRPCFDGLVNGWLRASEELQQVIDLYFGVLGARQIYLRNAFLNYAQAVEAYHDLSRRFRALKIEKGEYKRRAKEIKAIVTDDLSPESKQTLEDAIGLACKPSLQERLAELIDVHWSGIAGHVGSKDEFSRSVKVTRNALTHPRKSGRSKAATGIELAKLTRGLELLVRACLISELGLPEELKTEVLRRSRVSSRL